MSESSIASDHVAVASESWATYDRWNDAVAREFFAGRYGGRPVYLDLEAESLRRIATELEIPASAAEAQLIEAVRPTLRLRERGSLFGRHCEHLAEWIAESGREPPPVIAVLAFLSLVAERMRSDGDLQATNYYGRFAQTLNEDPQDRSLRQKVMRGFGDESHLLWSALNDWLEADPETRGYPTAFAFDYRVHVGRPMSQALVRERDRLALREMFNELRLTPRQEMARTDMKRLLGDWLPGSAISGHLKAMCGTDEVLQRVADVACIELRSWDGGVPETAGSSQRGQLAIVGTLQRLPRPRLRLGVSVRLAGDAKQSLSLGSESSDGAAAALADLEGRLDVAPADEEGWREIRDGTRVRIPDLLVSRVSLEADGVVIRRAPRRLVLLERDEGRLRNVEVERARLGVDYLMLATESLVPLLEPVLKECARDGYRKHEEGALAGVPTGWIAFSGVELIAITTAKHVDMASLVPVAWTQLSFGQGLALPGRQTWHSALAPEVRTFSAAPGEVHVQLLPEATRRRNGATMHATAGREIDLGSFTGAGAIALDERALEDGDYRVALLEGAGGKKTLTSSALRLRSADWAGPTPGEELALAHDPGAGALFALSASGETGVRGALVPLDLDRGAGATSAPSASLGEPMSEAGDADSAEADVEESPADRGSEGVVSLPNCMETGAHHFDLDLETRSRPAAWGESGGVCIHCGLEKFWPARLRGRRRSKAMPADRLMDAAVSRPDVPPRPPDPTLDLDVVLDALSFAGAGQWETLARIVGQLDDAPWASLQVARQLSALGHIDISRSVRDLRPDRWSIAPPAIVATEDDVFLSGWRSQALVDALARAAEARGAAVERAPQDRAPTRVASADLSGDEVDAVATELSEEIGRVVVSVRDPAKRLARALPPLNEFRQALPAISWPPDQRLERFDVTTGGWLVTSGPMMPGGYRTRRMPRRFWHYDGNDWRPADSRVVKWLSAFGQRALLAWDPGTRALACHLGCEPPGLFERAAVLCTGRPARAAGGEIVYEQVDESVAAALATRLGRE